MIFLEVGGSILFSGVSFYSKYALGLDYMGMMMVFGGMYVAMMPMSHLWSKLVRSWGFQRAWVLSILSMAFTALIFTIAQGIAGAVLAALFVGAGWSGTALTGSLMMALFPFLAAGIVWLRPADAQCSGPGFCPGGRCSRLSFPAEIPRGASEQGGPRKGSAFGFFFDPDCQKLIKVEELNYI